MLKMMAHKNYLLLQSVYRYLKNATNNHILVWKFRYYLMKVLRWFYTKNCKKFQRIFFHVFRYFKIWGKWWAILLFFFKCKIGIFGCKIYLLFLKAHSNGLSNKFIPTLSLINLPQKMLAIFGHWSWAVPINTAIDTRMLFWSIAKPKYKYLNKICLTC